MTLPIEQQALEQIGPAQERAVGGIAAAEHDVIAAAGAGVAAVDHELVGAEARLMRVFVEAARDGRPLRASLTAGWTLTSITPGSGVTG